MDEMNCFVIEGSKKLIFRKEDDRYICFDPEGLEFYEVNETAACILFLVAEKQKYYDPENTSDYIKETLYHKAPVI